MNFLLHTESDKINTPSPVSLHYQCVEACFHQADAKLIAAVAKQLA